MTAIQNVIDYVDSWRERNGVQEDIRLTEEQLQNFAKDIQTKIGELSFKSAASPNANIIPFSGMIGDTPAWKIAKDKAKNSAGKLIFIGDTEAGQLIYDGDFICAVIKALGEDEVLADRLFNGSRVKAENTTDNQRTGKNYVDEIIIKAKAAELADGIFMIVCHNNMYSHMEKEKFIDPKEIFPKETNDSINSWISRVNWLLNKNHFVGDAFVECAVARNKGESSAIERAEKAYQDLRSDFIKSNPGFSEDTYEHAIRLGAGKAVH